MRRWLGLTAFYKVLQRKPALHGALLGVLREQLEAPATQQLAWVLGTVVDDQHSDVFQQIRY